MRRMRPPHAAQGPTRRAQARAGSLAREQNRAAFLRALARGAATGPSVEAQQAETVAAFADPGGAPG
eukprot:11158391-Lingulodinium_polyedra.AAC.1